VDVPALSSATVGYDPWGELFHMFER
jgi:hypothetical protein